jgi:hypothetical protein
VGILLAHLSINHFLLFGLFELVQMNAEQVLELQSEDVLDVTAADLAAADEAEDSRPIDLPNVSLVLTSLFIIYFFLPCYSIVIFSLNMPTDWSHFDALFLALGLYVFAG